jgi:hypothetical protein
MPPINESETQYEDRFDSGVGVFISRYHGDHFALYHDHKRIGRFGSRLDAHQLIFDQTTGVSAWDDLDSSIALERLNSDERWIRLGRTTHSVVGDGPHNIPTDSAYLHVPPTVRPRIRRPSIDQ